MARADGPAALDGAEVDPPAAGNVARRQAAWTVVSQVLSSLANFGLTIAVARAVDEIAGGAFTYAFLIFSFGLGVSRAVCTDPLIITFSAVAGEPRRAAVRQAAGATLALGIAAGSLCLAAALITRGELGLALGLLIIVLPGQFLQDCWRNAAFVTGEPRAAAINDGVRVAVQFASIALCTITGRDDLIALMLCWAGGAWAGALAGLAQFGGISGARRSLGWLTTHMGLSLRLAGAYTINMGVSTLVVSLLAALLGLAATGGLRFAQSILGPINLFFGAVDGFMFPLMARRLAAHGRRSLFRLGLALSGVCGGLSALVVALLLSLPDSIGRELLGSSWDEARLVMPAVGAAQCAIALAIGGAMVLKTLGRAGSLLTLSAIQAPLILLLGVGGGLLTGIQGAAWGLAIAQSVGAVVVLELSRRASAA